MVVTPLSDAYLGKNVAHRLRRCLVRTGQARFLIGELFPFAYELRVPCGEVDAWLIKMLTLQPELLRVFLALSIGASSEAVACRVGTVSVAKDESELVLELFPINSDRIAELSDQELRVLTISVRLRAGDALWDFSTRLSGLKD